MYNMNSCYKQSKYWLVLKAFYLFFHISCITNADSIVYADVSAKPDIDKQYAQQSTTPKSKYGYNLRAII